MLALAVLAADLGVLVAGIEAAVLATGFLVGQGASRAAAEAAWKLVLVCSAGLALALLGTVLIAYVGSDVEGMRIAVVLLVVGFGALAGLAPLHAWSPDAHGQAPAPVAALLSGALLSVAGYALLRVKALSDLALGTTFGRVLLAALAVVSLLVAASLLLAQRDYQRMLAYSSTGQLGLVALGAAIGGPLALAAVLLHLLGHGAGEGRAVPRRRADPPGHRHQPDRRRARARRPPPDARRRVRRRRAGAARAAAVQPVRERAGHRACRVRRRARLARRPPCWCWCSRSPSR